MNPVGKLLWFIESHFAQGITLEEIAGHCDVPGVVIYWHASFSLPLR